MASGAGFQMDAIKNLKGNRGLLKKTEAFDSIRQNKFINAPKFKVAISKNFYDSLKFIQAERLKKARQVKNFLVLVVSTLVILAIVCLAYFSGK